MNEVRRILVFLVLIAAFVAEACGKTPSAVFFVISAMCFTLGGLSREKA